MDNKVDYFEIGSPDPEVSKAFYGQLFNWNVGAPSPLGYSMVNTNQGGMWDTKAIGGAHWGIFYVHVADVKKAVAKAEELGDKVLVPFTDNGMIEFAHIEDLHSNRFGVWRPKTANS